MTRLLWAGAFLSVIFYLVAEWSYANGQAAPPSGARSDLRRDPGESWPVALCGVAPTAIGLRDLGRDRTTAREHV